MPAFTHLHVHSGFSFRDGASDPAELVERCSELGMDALALTDHDGLYGAIRFYKACRKAGIKPIVGMELVLEPDCRAEGWDAGGRQVVSGERSGGSAPRDGTRSENEYNLPRARDAYERGHHLTLLAKDPEGYRNLCRIITGMHLRFGRAETRDERDYPVCPPEILAAHASHLFALSGCRRGLVPSFLAASEERQRRPPRGQGVPGKPLIRHEDALAAARSLANLFDSHSFFIELQHVREENSSAEIAALAKLAKEAGLPVVATNNVHYTTPDAYRIHDVLASVKSVRPISNKPRRMNGELYFKSSKQMATLFKDHPEALANTGWIADRCNLELDLETFKFPEAPLPAGETAFSYLSKLCLERLGRLYRPLTTEVTDRLSHELRIIDKMGFAAYFIIVYDIVRFAKSRGIRCSGRGSAADSLVCYLLGITTVDPIENKLLFERFLNPERRDMPDIDIDFDAARRDEVIDYVYDTYGHDRVAMVATVNTFRARSAVRDVAKAFDYEDEEIDKLAKPLPYARASKIREAIAGLPELGDYAVEVATITPTRDPNVLLDVCEAIDGFPRHLGVHLAGLIIAPTPLTDYLPLQYSAKGVVVAQFDKDDIEDLGLVKMDILGLRTLSAIEDAQAMVRAASRRFDIDALPLDDEATFAHLRSTKTVGVFQLESPGMRELLGRLQPTRFADIVANISLFRPGPMQADMITPYIARRHGEQPVTFDHPSIEPHLAETFGVIIYQEQILEIAAILAGFSLGQADQLRRAMTHDRSPEEMAKIREGFIKGCLEGGVTLAVAETVFDKIKAFAAFGFNKAHAASFGLIAYQSAYLRGHHPAELLVGILNNMPMGFYSPAVIFNEIKRSGIAVAPLDINASRLRFAIEHDPAVKARDARAVRVPLSYVKGISQMELKEIVAVRSASRFLSLDDFRARTNVCEHTVESLVKAGAFDEFGSRKAQLASLAHSLPLEVLADDDFTDREKLLMEYEILGLYQREHPMTYLADELSRRGVVKSNNLPSLPDGKRARVAGLLINRQTPPTKSGQRIIFSTIEDECGLVDVTLFERDQTPANAKANTGSFAVLVEGQLRKTGAKGIGIIAKRVERVM